MKILLIDNGSKYLGKLRHLLLDSGNEVKVEKWFAVNKEFAENFDIIVLSGGHQFSVLTNPDLFVNEIDLIKHLDKPIIGICLGFELIAYTFGANLTQSKKHEKGAFEIMPIKSGPIFAGINKFEVFESHSLAVPDLKRNKYLTALAKSTYGIEIIKHKTKPIYGFQFHPEMFVDKLTGDNIFLNTLNLLSH